VSRRGHGVAILAFGSVMAAARNVADRLDLTLADMRFVKPLDLDLLRELATRHEHLVTIEENVVMGGAGSAVAEALAGLGVDLPILHLGLPDRFVEHGDHGVLLDRCGLSERHIEAAIRPLCSKTDYPE
jgi:1-deoxy-D-xylulose-5-phosphate synthase